MQPKASTVDGYLRAINEPQRAELQRLLGIVKKEVPEAEESISYEMPALKYKNKPLVYFGAFSDHMSIFPTSGPIAELEDELKKYTTGKGTLSYKLEEPFPEELLKKILKVRVAQIG